MSFLSWHDRAINFAMIGGGAIENARARFSIDAHDTEADATIREVMLGGLAIDRRTLVQIAGAAEVRRIEDETAEEFDEQYAEKAADYRHEDWRLNQEEYV